MSRNSTKKNEPKTPEPMDVTVTEAKVGTPSGNSQRVCHAAKTLVGEVREMFPETPAEYSNYDGRNTALDVTFDLTALDSQDKSDFIALMTLFDFDGDPRVSEVLAEDGALLVSFNSNPRTQDSREPFGLVDAMSIISGRDEYTYDETVGSW